MIESKRKILTPFAATLSKIKGKRISDPIEWNQKVVMYCDRPGRYSNRRFEFGVESIIQSYNWYEYFESNGNHVRSVRHYNENKFTGEVKYLDIKY